MFYIHQAKCISPQETFSDVNLTSLHEPVNNHLVVIEPPYPGIAPGVLRRMSKAGRIGMATAMAMLEDGVTADGIIIGTANGGMEESIRFIKQIVEYNEDMLAPGSFVQSTATATAAQLAMLKKNHGYNITHVHRALAFENSLIDVRMLLNENPSAIYLVGGVDEIASYNYQVEYGAGWYKKENISNKELYHTTTPGSIAGEGAGMFLVSNKKENAMARLLGIATVHSYDEEVVCKRLQLFIEKELPAGETIDLLLSGENGDNRYTALFERFEKLFSDNIPIARFKHMCGEYPTASAFALWLACCIKRNEPLPTHMVKRKDNSNSYKNILIVNSHHGNQHGFILVSLLK